MLRDKKYERGPIDPIVPDPELPSWVNEYWDVCGGEHTSWGSMVYVYANTAAECISAGQFAEEIGVPFLGRFQTGASLINLTPHALTVRLPKGDVTLAPSGQVARVATSQTPAGEIAGVPVVITTTGEVSGIPEPQGGVTYITSSMVAQAANRRDVVAPDTGATAIRENGQIVAVTRFQTFVP